MVSVAQTLLQRKICGPIWQMLLQAWSGVFHGRGDSFWGQRCCDKAPGVNVLTGKDLLPPPQDQKRMEKISKRVNAIEEVNNNVKLLTEMVTNYSKGETTESNEDLMKVRRGSG